MDSQIIDTVSEWETVPVDSGYEGLHRLADDGFSGAVSSGSAWAFVLNGRVIGVFDGDIDAFEGEALTAYRAPDPALSLLYAMRQIGGETQARYYTNETPLSDADDTLSSGGFTGYVELSENVLSGDYYVVYHGGKSLSAAFVGNNERLVTGEDAFERADDEVGIYEVKSVDVSVVELPELDTETEPDADAGSGPTDAEGGPVGAGSEDEALGGSESADAADESPVAEAADADEPVDVDEPADRPTEAEASMPPATEPPAGESVLADDAPDDAREETPSRGVGAGRDASPEEASSPTADAEADAADPTASGSPDAAADSGSERSGDDPFSAEEQWRNARSIPSLDPSESSTANGESGGGAQAVQKQAPSKGSRERKKQKQQRRQQQRQRARAQRRERQRAEREKRRRQAAEGTAANAAEDADSAPESGGADDLTERLEAAEARREALSAERDELEAERDDYRDRAEELQAEVERLRAEVERMQEKLEAASGGFVAEESMSPENALSGTNLFVRYDRKGQATLEHAREGQVSRQEVVDNLRLEHHTTFDTESLAVDGTPYEEFLHESTEYAFAKWVVTDLLYEIGETGNRNSLSDLFDALPRVDRVELRGVVGFETEEGVEERSFDVIFRDQMGDPLFVADMNTSRNAASEAMVSSLVGNARAVGESDDALKTAFYVTESFFEPEALEAVAEETGGGLLSRSKRKSFVKLSRKRGFHVCLVEARNNEFHVNVPDL